MLNVLVTGSNGQLGSEIKDLSTGYSYHFFFTDKNELDIADESVINRFVKLNAIDAIINCAAYTAVDKAETEETMADRVNHLSVENLAEIAKKHHIKLIHISTDYVFDGRSFKPYVENEPTNPQSVYGSTKLSGEEAMLRVNPKNSIIIRTSWVYSSFGANFVKTMLRLGKEKGELGVIYDQIGTPTYAGDLAKAILDILPVLNNEGVSIYHYSNEGVCSWYDFANAIFELSGISCKVNAIETKEYPTPAVRPHYSLLNKAKIKKEFKLSVPFWKESLATCLDKMGEKK